MPLRKGYQIITENKTPAPLLPGVGCLRVVWEYVGGATWNLSTSCTNPECRLRDYRASATREVGQPCTRVVEAMVELHDCSMHDPGVFFSG